MPFIKVSGTPRPKVTKLLIQLVAPMDACGPMPVNVQTRSDFEQNLVLDFTWRLMFQGFAP